MTSATHYSLVWLQRGAALGAIMIGLLAILGAVLDLPILAQGLPDLPPLTVPGALAIIAAAAATLSSAPIRRIIGLLLLMVSLVISLWLVVVGLGWLAFNPFAPLPMVLILVDLILGGIMLVGSSSRQPRLIMLSQLVAIIIILNAIRTLIVVFQPHNPFDLLINMRTGRALTSTSATILIGIAALCINPKHGLMELITSRRVASQLLRILLFAGTILPLSIFVLTELAWYAGLFGGGVGLLLMILANLIVFYRVAMVYDRADRARHAAEQALTASYAELDQRVAERTAALAEREAQLRALSDNLSGAMIYQITRDEADQPHFVYVSASAYDLSGLTPEQIIADASVLYAQIDPSQRESFLAQERAARQANAIFDIEVCKHTPMGLRWSRIRSRPRPNDNSKRIWDGIEVDITAQKETLLALERDRRAQAALFSCSQVLLRPANSATERDAAMYAVLEQLREVTFSDRTFLILLEYDQEGERTIRVAVEACAPDMPGFRVLIGDDAVPLRTMPTAVVQRVLDGQLIMGHLLEVLPADAAHTAMLHAMDVKSLLLLPVAIDGQVWGALSFHACTNERTWDIHEQLLLRTAADLIALAVKRWAHEDELRRRETLLAALFDMLPVGVTLSHRDGSLARANQAIQTMMGMTTADFRAGRYQELRYTLPDGSPLTRERWPIIRALAGEVVRDCEFCITRLDGSQCWVNVSAAPLSEAEMGAAMVATDITERRRTEQERLRFERQLQEARRIESLDVMAAGLAHDFNNILTAMLGHAELLRSDLPPESDITASLDAIMLGVRQASALTAQMLAYAGKGHLTVQPVELNQVVQELIELLRAGLHPNVTLRCILDPTEPTLIADATQVRQVLLNLLTNAIEAVVNVGGGHIVVQTGHALLDQTILNQAAFSVARPGPFGFFEVRDSGEGIAPERIDRIFEPFYSTRFTGRGLGLAAVQGIVRAHHGALFVSSGLGRGTTFSAYLPTPAHPDSPTG